MARHCKRRKKNYSSFSSTSSSKNSKESNNYYSRFTKNNKNYCKTLNSQHNHPYATRSKTSNTDLQQNIYQNNNNIENKKKLDGSIIYLGAYRKVPRLIDLETSMDCNDDQINEETLYKLEPVIIK